MEEIYDYSNEIKPYLNVELEDDSSPYGGTAFAGETLSDFLYEINDESITTMKQVNKALKECGIKPIKKIR